MAEIDQTAEDDVIDALPVSVYHLDRLDLADHGAVRIWRKNHDQQVAHLMTVYTPFSGGAVETSDYLWQQGKLVSVERHISGAEPDDVMLRSDL
ncbi:hypothetical protein ACZ87_03896 [Candidatus Erwinia dacicola]|uniref:Uncharacterized protein n=1 Tax=Candidatus Erwinia dacicola TaxID=252393 RepID=A0A328TG20_9GAMM|nr:hypothetical protein ACZ87_03896 [Candidatus Erwinia dacicola]